MSPEKLTSRNSTEGVASRAMRSSARFAKAAASRRTPKALRKAGPNVARIFTSSTGGGFMTRKATVALLTVLVMVAMPLFADKKAKSKEKHKEKTKVEKSEKETKVEKSEKKETKVSTKRV